MNKWYIWFILGALLGPAAIFLGKLAITVAGITAIVWGIWLYGEVQRELEAENDKRPNHGA